MNTNLIGLAIAVIGGIGAFIIRFSKKPHQVKSKNYAYHCTIIYCTPAGGQVPFSLERNKNYCASCTPDQTGATVSPAISRN